MAGFTFRQSENRKLHHCIVDAVERFSYKTVTCTLKKWTSVHDTMTVVQCIPDDLCSERFRGTFGQRIASHYGLKHHRVYQNETMSEKLPHEVSHLIHSCFVFDRN